LRKIVENQTATRATERIYLGGVEIYREFAADGTTIDLSRETLSVSAGEQVGARVETRTLGTDTGSAQQVRYQFANHLNSAALELDDAADVISYEEYFPFGATSYQAVASQTDVAKRYRYTGKEHDDENALYYHGARYYAAWLGRWTACDPGGVADGPNVYRYTGNRPTKLVDPNGREGGDPLANIGSGRVIPLGRTTIDFGSLKGLPFFESVTQNATRTTGLPATTFGGLLSDNPELREAWAASTFTDKELEDLAIVQLKGRLKGLPSGQMLQGVLEGETPIVMTTTQLDVFANTHTSDELRQLIAHLSAGRNANQDIHFVEGDAVSTIRKGTSVVEGAPLPPRIAKHLPPSFQQGAPKPPPAAPAPPAEPPVAPPEAPGAAPKLGGGVMRGVAEGVGAASVVLSLGMEGKDELSSGKAILGMAVGAAAIRGGGVALKAAAAALETPAGAVVAAGLVGVGVGVLAEKGLGVSDFSAGHGTATKEFLEKHGVGDTASLIAGGVVTVASSISGVALVEAAGSKILSLF
jgi:RHS repeat-associated protein